MSENDGLSFGLFSGKLVRTNCYDPPNASLPRGVFLWDPLGGYRMHQDLTLDMPFCKVA
jgi:hypothetical protein